MKKLIIAWVSLSVLLSAAPIRAGIFEDLLGGIKDNMPATGAGPDLETTISGLKEALSVGTANAVSVLSKNGGYFTNDAVKILMPEKIQNVADTLKNLGFSQQVDNFVLSMNRAAEQAAPQAKGFFLDAIKEMTFDDAKGILNGGDTSATEFLKSKTTDKIYNAFKPIVSSSLNKVGGTASYNRMMETFANIPFMSAQSLDLNHYVTEGALGGLFKMVGEEEKKIRTNPAARVTDVLQRVFGSK